MGSKCWPAEKFAELLDILTEKYDCGIIVFEGPHDKNRNDIIEASSNNHLVRAVGFSVSETSALLQNCSVLVTAIVQSNKRMYAIPAMKKNTATKINLLFGSVPKG